MYDARGGWRNGVSSCVRMVICRILRFGFDGDKDNNNAVLLVSTVSKFICDKSFKNHIQQTSIWIPEKKAQLRVLQLTSLNTSRRNKLSILPVLSIGNFV